MKPHNPDWDRPDAFHDPIGGDSAQSVHTTVSCIGCGKVLPTTAPALVIPPHYNGIRFCWGSKVRTGETA